MCVSLCGRCIVLCGVWQCVSLCVGERGCERDSERGEKERGEERNLRISVCDASGCVCAVLGGEGGGGERDRMQRAQRIRKIGLGDSCDYMSPGPTVFEIVFVKISACGVRCGSGRCKWWCRQGLQSPPRQSWWRCGGVLVL